MWYATSWPSLLQRGVDELGDSLVSFQPDNLLQSSSIIGSHVQELKSSWPVHTIYLALLCLFSVFFKLLQVHNIRTQLRLPT